MGKGMKAGKKKKPGSACWCHGSWRFWKSPSCASVVRQDILLLGYGRVGREIEKYLLEKEARLVIYDKDEDIRRKILAQGKVFLEKIEDMKRYELIMDATSTGPWITTDMLHKDVFIAAPGIPFSLDEETREDFQGRWVHDNLPIGTAVMLAYALGEEDGK